MKKLLLVLGLAATSAIGFGQNNPNYNPDYNGNNHVDTGDLLGLLAEFGNEFNFISPCDSIVVEENACSNENFVSYYGYTYDIVTIGNQCWFAENLRTDKYSNGDVIPYWFQGSPSTNEGQYCVYEHSNDENGYLYTYYTTIDTRNVCPSGWHVPNNTEWNIFGEYLGVDSLETDYNSSEWLGTNQGTELKSINWEGTNEWGFNALPGGSRGMLGNWGLLTWARWWSSSVIPSTGGDVSWGRALVSPNQSPGNGSKIWYTGFNNQDGLSIRCIKD